MPRIHYCQWFHYCYYHLSTFLAKLHAECCRGTKSFFDSVAEFYKLRGCCTIRIPILNRGQEGDFIFKVPNSSSTHSNAKVVGGMQKLLLQLFLLGNKEELSKKATFLSLLLSFFFLSAAAAAAVGQPRVYFLLFLAIMTIWGGLEARKTSMAFAKRGFLFGEKGKTERKKLYF